MIELKLKAVDENLLTVLDTVNEMISGCADKVRRQISISVEEIFINIVHYAYPSNDDKGEILVKCDVCDGIADISFQDSGIPYDPLKASSPDITLSAEERQVGGLGVFMVKKNMDEVFYEYRDGKNILTMKKRL